MAEHHPVSGRPDRPDRPDQPNELVERLKVWRAAHPLPAPTGRVADKAFFDWLGGEEGIEDVR
jgi:antitoxin VapB